MPNYTITLTQTRVEDVEADTLEEAIELAVEEANNSKPLDGCWEVKSTTQLDSLLCPECGSSNTNTSQETGYRYLDYLCSDCGCNFLRKKC